MNPFEILIPGFFAIAVIVGICWMLFYRSRPTEAEVQAFTFGYEDGDLGSPSMHFSLLTLQEAYLEGYDEGSRGRNRRADAELLKAREAGQIPERYEKRPTPPCTCGRNLRQQASEPGK